MTCYRWKSTVLPGKLFFQKKRQKTAYFDFLSVSFDFFACNHIVSHRYWKHWMFRTIFTILRSLLKSGLCATQLCPRSDTSSYTASLFTLLTLLRVLTLMSRPWRDPSTDQSGPEDWKIPCGGDLVLHIYSNMTQYRMWIGGDKMMNPISPAA